MIRLSSVSSASLLVLLAACGTDTADTADTGEDTDTGDTDTGAPEDIAVLGDWVDNWGGGHTVSNDAWLSMGSSYEIAQYDNALGHAIAQNGADNEWSPGLWSRFDWGWSDGELLYCQTAYGAATEAEALATPAADLSSPASGCGGFPWSILRAPFVLTDGWDDSWGGTHWIDAFTWQMGDSTFAITDNEPSQYRLIAQNGADNTYNPDLWSRFDWTAGDAGSVYYCQTAYAAATEADALATPGADNGDLAGGCGGFSWTEMRSMLSINGEWADGWGGTHTINAFAWTMGTDGYAISEADDSAGWLTAQNAASNSYNPSLWSRFDWTWDSGGTLWYCQTAYAAATEADALATPAADPADPATTGCGGFSWTSMAAP